MMKKDKNKGLLILGILFNLGLLGYFKYTDFLIAVANDFGHMKIPLLHVALPLGISFFTFQQLAYLVDTYKHKTHEHKPIDYMLFVTFFPQLIAGPIVHHSQMMPQFSKLTNTLKDHQNIATGLFIFVLGVCKKAVLADGLSPYVQHGFSAPQDLNSLHTWILSLAYTLQLYFDFSGYTDMARGCARLFNVTIPINFNSPYHATSIQDFWRRWHITLSHFLRDYIYIPLGGSKKGIALTLMNLFITFLLGGIWHGAGWTFIVWGALHGFALVLHRLWQTTAIKLPKALSWLITFIFVNAAWVVFRAPSLHTAKTILKKMADLPALFTQCFSGNFFYAIKNLPGFFPKNLFLASLTISILCLIYPKNTNDLYERFKPTLWSLFFFVGLSIIALLFLNSFTEQEFLYFDF